MNNKEMYMRRAIQLAANGRGYASPNPMVGAVIVAPGGRIIGEGWHRRCGEGHAEVNAVASVRECDRHLLGQSTMFVTLEPCSHHGKTPPCAELILHTGIPRVVVASVDPFEKVAGRGIAMLRQGGIEVETGLLDDVNLRLNRRFFTAHIIHRPYVTLKWARSADGYMDWRRTASRPGPCRFSNSLTSLSTMRMRSLHDAVLTTAATVMADNCRMSVRDWDGRQPRVFIVDRTGKLGRDAEILNVAGRETTVIGADGWRSPLQLFRMLYEHYGVTSVLVEAGPRFLRAILESDVWDAAREEIAPFTLGGRGKKNAPSLDDALLTVSENWDGNVVRWFENGISCEKI